ncbi:MAG: hypothetical protein U0795_05830 [Pirellulales bacterium]
MQWFVWAVLAAHLLSVNLAAGGPLAMVLIRGRGPLSSHARVLGQRVIRWTMGAFLVGTLLGLILLAVLWWADPERWSQTLWPQFRGKLLWGAGQLVTFVVGWALADRVWRRQPDGAPMGWKFPALAIFSATNLLYHFPPLFTLLASVQHGQLAFEGPLTAAAFRQWAFQPPTASLWVHVTLAAVAYAALVIAQLALSEPDPSPTTAAPQSPDPAGVRWGQRGCQVAALLTVLQLPVGFWVFVSQPSNLQRQWIGGDSVSTVLLFAGVALTVYLLNQLSEQFWATADLPSVRRSLVIMTLIVLLMTGALSRARRLPSEERVSFASSCDDLIPCIADDTPWTA